MSVENEACSIRGRGHPIEGQYERSHQTYCQGIAERTACFGHDAGTPFASASARTDWSRRVSPNSPSPDVVACRLAFRDSHCVRTSHSPFVCTRSLRLRAAHGANVPFT